MMGIKKITRYQQLFGNKEEFREGVEKGRENWEGGFHSWATTFQRGGLGRRFWTNWVYWLKPKAFLKGRKEFGRPS